MDRRPHDLKYGRMATSSNGTVSVLLLEHEAKADVTPEDG
jgi:hypothetical protein